VRRPFGLASLAVGLLAGVAGTVAGTTDALANWPPIGGYPATTVVGRTLLVVAVAGLAYGSYLLAVRVLMRSANKRRAHDVRNLLRLPFGVGDRIKIDDAKDDVIGIDFFVTTL